MTSSSQPPVPVGDKLSIVARNLSVIPGEYGQQFGNAVKNLDLSYNKLTKIENLGQFVKLNTLILDNNELNEDGITFPLFPLLETLCLNNNHIANIQLFLDRVIPSVPKLKHLSLLKNPACPNRLMGGDDDDYTRYRLYVLHRLPKLKFLDSDKVTPRERQEAERRGAFYGPTRLAVCSEGVSVDTSVSIVENNPEEIPENTTRFGKQIMQYYGRQSEGNRFISDKNL